ncbi:hypothetical protein SLEP1_g52599 [Rubroshorea leprosula]|uniref:Transposase (putative) gypsy type domain-containing protein n=1 Tax=Rubroshorea leprosula TaxID=152421 RepID=A0AAV5M7W3_9ROSI|nr:hypothetical protein SLEP1_g52599 [Rubroshorea leprosula]
MAPSIKVKPIFVTLLYATFHLSAVASKSADPSPVPWPPQFHSILFMNNSKGNLQKVDLWYDWNNGRNFNIIQNQLGKLTYDLEWDNGTSYVYTLDSNRECRTVHFPVGILRPNWLDGANYLGQQHVDGFLCNVWGKVDFIWYYEDVVTKRPVHWVFFTGITILQFYLRNPTLLKSSAASTPESPEVKMVSLRELTEQRGNQGRDGEEERVLAVEPITMIVPPELQDVPEIMVSESSTSSSAGDNGDGHHDSPSSSSSSGNHEPEPENVGDVEQGVPVVGEWENRVLPGRLSNIRKAPKDLPAGFKFKAALHHEVADCAPSISGYRRLEEMIQQYHIPRTISVRTGGQNERACTVSRTGWIPVYADHFDAGLRFPLPGLVFDLLAEYELTLTQLTPNSIRFIMGFMLLCARLEVPAKAIVFRSLFQCRLCPNSQGARWYYLSGRDKSQLFKNVRNKVARWKRQFIFVRDTRTERISNDLAARLSEWRTPNAHINYPQLLPRDVDLKNQLLQYAQREGLIDLEALVTSEHLAIAGFVDVTNLFSEGEMSSILERQRQRAQSSRGRGTGSSAQRQSRFDERPPAAPQSRSSSHRGSSSSSLPRAYQRVEVAAPSARRRAREETEGEEDEIPLARRIRSGSTQPAQAARPVTVRSPNAPSATVRAAAEPAPASASTSGPRIAYPEGFSYTRAECQPAMVQAMHDFVPATDNRRAKSFVQQHGGQVAMIKLMDSGIQAAMDEAGRVEERAKKAEADRDQAQHELSSLRHQVAEADRNLAATGEALNELKASHARSVAIARAQGAEWFVGSAAFQDAVAVASANVTTEIYNEIRGKVLQHRPDFPIRELVFFDEEELDEQGKSLAPLADAAVRLRWDLNEEGVPVWPPSILEDGEDPAGLPSFDAWVEGAPVAEQEPSSTPPSSQPAVLSAGSPVVAPAIEPAARSPSARSPAAAADASMPVDLTDD